MEGGGRPTGATTDLAERDGVHAEVGAVDLEDAHLWVVLVCRVVGGLVGWFSLVGLVGFVYWLVGEMC